MEQATALRLQQQNGMNKLLFYIFMFSQKHKIPIESLLKVVE